MDTRCAIASQQLQDVRRRSWAIAPFDDACAEHYGMLRADLERSGRRIGPNDLRIAATARARDLALVAANTREFQRIVGLRRVNREVES
jgi:tRNA(fMet)-specific endonuclease VapC